MRRIAGPLLLALLLATGPGCRSRKKPAAGAAPQIVALPENEIQVGEPGFARRLVRGVYPGAPDWRWTEPRFELLVDAPDAGERIFLEMDFAVPTELLSGANKDVTVTARVNGKEVGRKTYTAPARLLFAAETPPAVLAQRRPARVEIEANRSFRDEAGLTKSLIVVNAALRELTATAAYRDQHQDATRAQFQKLLEARSKVLPREKYKQFLKLFHELPVWSSQKFEGLTIIKNPLDLWVVQQIIAEQKPDFLIETGTLEGGSALYYAMLCEGLGLHGTRILTVDIGHFCGKAEPHPLWRKYVEFYHGSSTDPAIVERIAARVKGKRTLVMLDSDHRMVHVLRELRMYGPLVSKGGYLVVEDTHMDGVPTYPDFGLGPFAAVQRFLAEGGAQDFAVDETREGMVMTFNPGGWLRRK